MRPLILGATGMLGHKLWQRLRVRFPETYATIRPSRAAYARCGLFQAKQVFDGVDASDFQAVSSILDRVSPDVVVNCVAVTKRRDQADNPLACIELNAAFPHRLASWSRSHRVRIIHFSTDCVFDGCRGGYSESDPTNAQDLYGRTKALGELTAPGTLTLRTSFIGRELGRGTELLEWFLAQRGRRIRGFRNATYSGVSTLYMADLVGDLIERFPDLGGLYQIAAPLVTKFDLLCFARSAYNVPVEIDADESVVVRRDLDGTRFRHATGIEVPDWPTMMQTLAADSTPYQDWR
jgi:dTDP-4-dehydrorhamnose reductase